MPSLKHNGSPFQASVIPEAQWVGVGCVSAAEIDRHETPGSWVNAVDPKEGVRRCQSSLEFTLLAAGEKGECPVSSASSSGRRGRVDWRCCNGLSAFRLGFS